MTGKFEGVAVNDNFNVKALHDEMQKIRKNSRRDVTLKGFLAPGGASGLNMTPDQFYRELGVDMQDMTVQKMLNTSELNRWLFPEITRDAIRQGLEYTPFHSQLVAVSETIPSTGLTMPYMDLTGIDRNQVKLRDVGEGATIPEGEIIAWREKQVNIRKKARGLKQTYESIMFTPIDLAALYFQELGTQLGADLDKDLINVAVNGDQADGSEAAPVIGVTSAGTLTYTDVARAWIRFKRIGRNSSVMLATEADALTIMNMDAFQKTLPYRGESPSGITINVSTPLPTSQSIFVHDSVPTGKIILVDTSRAFAQLTAMPLLIESERIVSRQIEGEYVSIITGFANIFKDGRLILDTAQTLGAAPGPTVPTL